MTASFSLRPWLLAARPRTLLLAVANIGMGIFLAGFTGQADFGVGLLCLLTAALLQILSNVANDYGDSVHGADSHARVGPARAVQSGLVSSAAMKTAVGVVALLAVTSGVALVALAFGPERLLLSLTFIALGGAAVWAAVAYTATRNPYGYVGLGDAMVFVFFGPVAVLGSYYAQTQSLIWDLLLPATASGLLAVAVLNVNNLRDLESDRQAGKRSVPVRVGARAGRVYHLALLVGSAVAAFLYVFLNYVSPWQFLFVPALPLFVLNAVRVWRGRGAAELDPLLKQMSITTLVFTLLFGLGLVLG